MPTLRRASPFEFDYLPPRATPRSTSKGRCSGLNIEVNDIAPVTLREKDGRPKHNGASGHPDTVNRFFLSCDCRRPYSVRAWGRNRGCRRDAEQEGARPAFKLGHNLFRVPVRRVPHNERAVVRALGRGLPPVHSRDALIRVCLSGTPRCTGAWTPMAEDASHRHGRVLYPDAYRVLCG